VIDLFAPENPAPIYFRDWRSDRKLRSEIVYRRLASNSARFCRKKRRDLDFEQRATIFLSSCNMTEWRITRNEEHSHDKLKRFLPPTTGPVDLLDRRFDSHQSSVIQHSCLASRQRSIVVNDNKPAG
jgi:hypothetical protein